MGIEIELPAAEVDAVRLDWSPLLEAVLSWHVLADAGHHTLQLPWVRRCRALPADLRTELRRMGWVVGGYVPSVFTWARPAEDFGVRVARVRELPEELLAAELGQSLKNAPLFGFNRPAAEIAYWRNRIAADVRTVLAEFLDILQEYWEKAFGAEWQELDDRMVHIAEGLRERLRLAGVWSLLQVYRPALDIDQERRVVVIDRPHDHRISTSAAQPLTIMLSEFAWPHIRVLCDMPWPPVLVLPIHHLARSRRTPPLIDDLLTPLRAIASETRLNILSLLAVQPRSTNELGTMLHMSAPAVSRSLRRLEDAGLVRSEREGPYVMYMPSNEALNALVEHLGAFVTSLTPEIGGEATRARPPTRTPDA
jgi:DNA-binding transcriptional ArsR family regulator